MLFSGHFSIFVVDEPGNENAGGQRAAQRSEISLKTTLASLTMPCDTAAILSDTGKLFRVATP